MKHTPPPTKKTPTGAHGQPPAGSTGTGSTGVISTTSSSATKEAAARFATDDDKLQADGSNFRNWLNEITEFAIMSLDDPTFYDHPQPADAKETSTPAAGVATCMRNKLLDLCEAGLDLDNNTLCGIVWQTGVAQGSDLRREFDLRIDQELSRLKATTLPFNTLVKALDNSKHRAGPPTAFPAEARPTVTRQALIESHPDNVYVQAASIGFSSRPARPALRAPGPANRGCFRCGATDHYISQCNAPQSSPPSFSAPPASFPSSAPGHSPYPGQFIPCALPSATHHGYLAHYPVLTPSYAPYATSYGGRAPVPNPGLRPADSYRPNYQQQAPPSSRQPAICEVEMDYGTGDQTMDPPRNKAPPDVSFSIATSNATPSADVVFDTGATHHVTGDRAGEDDFCWTKLNSYPA
ncbi:hypothetical protein PCANC_23115 [Puccinia coronata f. sp. avenae]|uniref:CCHC-type domain-containing protein n=1 Tax=Puccinia coronata f. sp. avenae TaxID=200324 RepID=A0A2N5TSM6_9BASI|nr:hypothetical protein PCANC_23115 [Puccinia coronata f. sp. avenae]